ncbi:ABC transporter permease [Candidatus Laterigemmans baculatus]|uniref:ABC transporter permease n=1 Tax=Candidatus Laterigemmans baculatus TaxID=2770505 RepID=UPI0013DA24FF|nr:ABC transporter permease [Candidatus Laterigemmans baculatus]
MLGPVFLREAIATPRRPRFYLARSVYLLSLFLLLCTGYLVLAGTQPLRTAGDLARFGGWMFLLLAPLQLLVLSFQAAVGAASSVAQEKDRRTLLLLLLTRISGFELVVGKLAAALLGVGSMLAAALPLFLALTLFGGVSLEQVFDVYLVTLTSLIAASAVGTVVGLWREKSFQTIAVTLLAITLWLGFWEIVAAGGVPGLDPQLAGLLSPIRALLSAAQPLQETGRWIARPALAYTLLMLGLSALVTGWGILRVRVWNPSREVRGHAAPRSEEPPPGLASAGAAQEPAAATWKVREPRRVWSNPILWREVRTRAYGSKIILIRAAYLLVFALAAVTIWTAIRSGAAVERPEVSGRVLPAATLPMAALGVVSLVIVNALAVNSITSERDALALDLLMVTDLSPREFLFGKLLGVLYVTKEMVLLPMALIVYLAISDVVTAENAVYAMLGAAVLYIFVATLGIHCGLSYPIGRTATLVSLGTVFFLCVGIAICMVIMVSFRGAFQLQLAPFLIIILGGGAALYAALGWRNPSGAIFAAAIELPLVTYYAITQFLLQQDQLPVAATVITGYGFATAAMLVPALSEFSVADSHSHGGSEEGL